MGVPSKTKMCKVSTIIDKNITLYDKLLPFVRSEKKFSPYSLLISQKFYQPVEFLPHSIMWSVILRDHSNMLII